MVIWHSHRVKPTYNKVLDSPDCSLLVALKDGTVRAMPWTPDGYGTYYDEDGHLLGERISNNGKTIKAWAYMPAPPENLGVML